ncbi:MAG: ankyrin repeat domain-containing protein [Candidatus Cardinium sp.]|nr:MAG: ankyrin repeat domain-containing protein [Candidatus Cardinium sp.]
MNDGLENKRQTFPETVLEQYGAIIRTLWQNNPNLLKHQQGYTALHIAAKENNLNIISFLLNSLKGVDLDILQQFVMSKERRNGCTALHLAALNGHDATVTQLLASFKDDPKALQKFISAKDNNGRTTLHGAALKNNPTVVASLLESFRDDPKALKEFIKTQDEDGHTALHGAAKWKRCHSNAITSTF